ncbi:MAG: dihydrolipoyl dehydrogenase [Alphaproteobacteria bacterium]|nr:MAG: dihydrolipoyl dehydrogenase [Alphaproteobacteria bacterium]
MASFDLIVIGAGPGGYVCAIRAAQLGMRVAVVEKRPTLGGTCLNVGCIPSKALLHATHQLHEARHNFAAMGIGVGEPKVDWAQMQAFKDGVVEANTRGIEFLFKKNRIERLAGHGRLLGSGRVEVTAEDGTTSVHDGRHIVIATGSEPATLPGIEIDEERVVTSTGALALARIPRQLVVIGAGVIGLELGSVYARLGAKVTVVEYLDHITPGMDGEVQKGFQRILRKQGLTFVLGAQVTGVEKLKTKLKVHYRPRKGGDEVALDADTVLVATGRRPFTEGLGFTELGGRMTERGQIAVDAHGATSIPHVWAIGDVTPGPMLAHKAEEEGVMVAERIAGRAGHVNHALIPSVIYTHPEVAAIGATEEALKAEGRAYRTGKFQFMANGRAKASMAAEGFVKLIADAETDRILGAHLIGPMAGELIHEIAVAMEFGAAAEDVARTCHAHPTFSEAVREAALACGDGPIHA